MPSPPTTRRSALARIAGVAVGGLEAVRTTAARVGDNSLAGLSDQLTGKALGRVVLPGNAEYAGIRYYNGRFDCVRPGAFVRPATTEGVAAFVRWAAAHKRTFAIRGAGHSFEGKSLHADLVLDMSQMRGLALQGEILDVQGGVQLGAVYDKLSPLERVFPAGTCPTVGVVGHTLGGGIGDYLPMFGYAAQSLEQVELVTFQGAVLTINDEGIAGEATPMDVDPKRLMRMLRGAGQGSLGVVTRMKLRTFDVREAKLASFKLEGGGITSSRMIAVIDTWQRWRTTLPTEMQSVVSAKLDLGRSGSSYSCEIAGLIAVPPRASQSVETVRRTLDPLFSMPELPGRSFAPRINAAGAVKSFLDTPETTRNPSRKRLYGASSALPAALPRAAVEHLVLTMVPTVNVSIYTAGGVSTATPETCLHPSAFIIEWTIYANRADPAHRRRIADLRTSTIRTAGWPDDLGYPNYPDGDARNYFRDAAWIEQTARRFDPKSASSSSLLSSGAPTNAANAIERESPC